MSLRTAMTSLSDDRESVRAVREVVACFSTHRGEPLGPERVARIVGFSRERTDPVLRALASALVINCDGDPSSFPCTFTPDSVLALEVERFLRQGDPDTERLQSNIDRFRRRTGRV